MPISVDQPNGGPACKLALALMCVAVLASGAEAQQTSGIAGVVRDTSGAVLPGVTVEASSPALIEKVRTANTDGQGLYDIVGLPPGTYVVTFTLPGFSTLKREGIDLTAGFTATVNADLRVGQLSENVTVTGASPVVDTRNVSADSVMTREVIDAIPTGKNFANLGALIPGVSTWSNLGGQDSGGALGNDGQMMIIHGSRTSDQLVRVDGMPMGMLDGAGAPPIGTPSDAATQETLLSTGSHVAEVETGGFYVNIIPRVGSNMYTGNLFGTFADDKLQGTNLTAADRAAGLNAGGIKHNTDASATYGGPIQRDRLWFFGSYRDRRSVRNSPLFADTHTNPWAYTPDFSSPAPDEHKNYDVTGRVTWQISARNKLNVSGTWADDCWCEHIPGSTNGVTLDATVHSLWPNHYSQVSWTSPVTNRLLLEAAGQIAHAGWNGTPQPTSVGPAAFEQSNGFRFRAYSLGLASGYQNTQYINNFARFAVSYVTGSHAFKVGGTVFPAQQTSAFNAGNGPPYQVLLLNGKPVGVTYLPFPFTTVTNALKTGTYAQDQWTLKRFTMNLGLRFDSIGTNYPNYSLAATPILPARNFPGADVLRWRDLDPRVGVAYDVFGDGKTAIKASVNRYVAGETTGTTRLEDPTLATGSLTRSWNDVNGDVIPQGDPLNPAANGELGPSPNAQYGVPRYALSFDPAWALGGLGKRPYNWEFSTSVQHQLVPGVSSTLAYIRRIYGNFTVVNNTALNSSNYNPYCIQAPADPRLGSVSGTQICGLYDLNPKYVGMVNNVETLSSNYGKQYEHYDSIDLTLSARLPHGVLLQGGLGTLEGVTDNCDILTKLGNNPNTRFCHFPVPWLTQLKFLGSYTLPWWALQVAATYSDVPGIGAPATPAVGLQASYVATNAVVAPSLGRNLSSSTFVSVPLLAPGSMYTARLRQLDLRVARTFVAGRKRFKAMVDFYNLFNASTPVLTNDTYGTNGASWLNPLQILQARYAKLGVQIDF